MNEIKKEHIVVIGGGFAGLNFLKYIDKNRYSVTLVDRNNFHSFPPLFYQVASSGLDPASIAFPFRREMRKYQKQGADYHMGEVQAIDVQAKTVTTNMETIRYDKLVIAAGTTNNFFGNDDLKERVFTLKATSEALRVRNEVLDRLERASVCRDPAERKRLLSFIVVGGGPTGVEIAGALGEMKRYVITREYPRLDPQEIQIVLMEGSDKLLRTMSETASREALKGLNSLMVEVRLNTLMQNYERGVVTLADGSAIESEMVIWTAGITGEPFAIAGAEGYKRGPGGRFVTDEFNRVEGLTDVYALGDISYTVSELYPHGFPQLAQVAIQQAKRLALSLNEGEFKVPFSYNDKGSMATIGRNRAVADLKHFHLTGFIAWLAWMFVHLISILGMRNKITVMINWMWAYFTYNTSMRLLIHTNRFPLRRRWQQK